MIGSVVQCPKCELRFSFRTELEYHLREDHPQPAAAEQSSAVKVDEGPTRTAMPVAAPVRARAETVKRRARWSRGRVTGFLLTIAAVLLVACAAAFVSLASALIIAVAVLVMSGIYARRTRGRPRLPRR